MHAEGVVNPAGLDVSAEPHVTQGGVADGSFQYPDAQMHADAPAVVAGLDASATPQVEQRELEVGSFQKPEAQPQAVLPEDVPHTLQMVIAPVVSFQLPVGQSMMQRLVGAEMASMDSGSQNVAPPQSAACTGQTVAAFSPLARQQQRRVAGFHPDDWEHVDDAAKLA